MWSTGSKERVGQQASWGPGVPTPGCLRQRGSKTTTLADGHQRDERGVLGSPPLAVWRSALTGQSPLLTTSGGVLGSLSGCLHIFWQPKRGQATSAPAT